MADVRERQTSDKSSANSTSSHKDEPEPKKKSNKPANTAFKQQRLPAWQPILTAGTVLPAFFIIGVLFVALGAIFYVTSNNVQEKVVEYTDCTYVDTTDNETRACKDLFDEGPNMDINCTCRVEFELETKMEGEVYMLYMLTNYYQNHRRYVNSRDDLQLLGETQTTPNPDCIPYRFDSNTSVPIAPCGAIANSMFSDTFSLFFNGDGTMNEVTLNGTGIAWNSDRNTKFNNPKTFDGTTSPPNWPQSAEQLPNGYKNEDFIVWMRTAALPTFRKLHRRVIRQPNSVFDKGLPAGTYVMNVRYSYPVHMFEGTKSIVLTTTSWLGGKNTFLGIAYIVTGSLCVLFGTVFLFIHIKYGHRGNNMEGSSTVEVG